MEHDISIVGHTGSAIFLILSIEAVNHSITLLEQLQTPECSLLVDGTLELGRGTRWNGTVFLIGSILTIRIIITSLIQGNALADFALEILGQVAS